MDENERDTPIDLARIDAHVISDREYEEIPELTDEDFARGSWSPGRFGGSAAPQIRHYFIDPDVLARFQATGPGWQDRIDRILRDAADALEAG